MAVPDWPTTFGMNMFFYNFFKASWGVFGEHTHRLYGAAVGLFTILLTLDFLAFDRRAWMKGLGVVGAGRGDRQGVLGGCPGPAGTRRCSRRSTASRPRRSSDSWSPSAC